MTARILAGTCSWADKSLVECGRFYPPQLKTAEERLRHYAGQFPLVEVDSSYYGPPAERNAALWVECRPPPSSTRSALNARSDLLPPAP